MNATAMIEAKQTTIDKVKTLIINHPLASVEHIWPSLRYCAKAIAENIEGCELTPWENIIKVDGEFCELYWMNRKHSAILVRAAEAPED